MSKISKGAGSEVLTYCTKCETNVTRIVVAMVGDRVAKVRCQKKNCGKEMKYRSPEGSKTEDSGAARSAPRRTTTRAEPVPVGEEWRKVLAESSGKPLKTYTAKTAFQIGDRVDHPVFGMGVVRKVVHPNKVEILFEADLKLLIHAGAP